VLLLPLGLLLAFGIASPRGRRLRNVTMAAALLGVMAAVFVPVYNYYNVKNNEYPVELSEYLSDPKMLQEYLDTDAAVGSSDEAGRVDATVVPFVEITRSPISLAFGFGMGNASNSSLGTDFSGAYDALYNSYVITTSSAVLLLETGLLGCLLVVLFNGFVLKDSLTVARRDSGPMGAFAAGWSAVIVVTFLGLFYLPLHNFESLAYLYLYFCGVTAAHRTRLQGPDAQPSVSADFH